MNFPPPTVKQARLIWAALTGVAIAVLVGLVITLVWGIGQVINVLAPVLLPLSVAWIIAYLLDPLVDGLERRHVPRQRAIVFVFAMTLVLVAGYFGSVVPQIIAETRDLAQRIPTHTQRLQARIDTWVSHPPDFVRQWLGTGAQATNAPSVATATNLTASAPTPQAPGAAPTEPARESILDRVDRATLQSATQRLGEILPTVGRWLFGQVGKVAAWFGTLAGLALIPIYAFYFLWEKPGIQSQWTEYLPVAKSGFKDELVFVLGSINGYLIAFFRGQVLVAICDGILYTIGFVIIGLPYAVLLGALATLLTIIPFLGAIVTFVLAMLVAIVQHGDWQHPLMVCAVFAVVQTLESLVISPKIMGDKVGLHPVTIIIALMIGTTLLGGILGGILAIPLTAALRVILFRYVWKRRQSG